MSADTPRMERRASARLPRESYATVTDWIESPVVCDRDPGADPSVPYCPDCHVVTTRHYGITDGTQTIEYPTLHAARMAAYIHNTQHERD